MDINSAIQRLEEEWTKPDGFLGQLRMGVFERSGATRLMKILQTVKLDNEAPINRRFVSLSWYIPLFMLWQRERVAENGGNIPALELSINEIQAKLEDLLGVP